jgi:hypothetical protein
MEVKFEVIKISLMRDGVAAKLTSDKYRQGKPPVTVPSTADVDKEHLRRNAKYAVTINTYTKNLA